MTKRELDRKLENAPKEIELYISDDYGNLSEITGVTVLTKNTAVIKIGNSVELGS